MPPPTKIRYFGWSALSIETGDGVLFFDLTGHEMEGYNKFIPYYLFPNSVYTVSVSPSSFRTISLRGSSSVTRALQAGFAPMRFA